MLGVARHAERLGFDSVWLYDHLQAVSGDLDTTFECWTSLAAIARETARVRLGQIVTCNSFRNPALLAKMAATLDAASGGRAIVGLGAGWDQREYDAYGFEQPYPSTGERLARLGEAAAVVKAMLRNEVSTIDGRYHYVRGALNIPAAPEVPLLIGGSGEKVTLRIVAAHGDACNLTDSTDPEFYRRKLQILASHCEALERDYDSILRTASFSVFTAATEAELDRLVEPHLRGRERAELAAGSAVGTPAQLVETFNPLVEAGIQHFILYVHTPTDLDRLALFAEEVIPHVG